MPEATACGGFKRPKTLRVFSLLVMRTPAPRIEVISRPQAADLKNFAASITGENFANSDKLGVVGRRCVKVSVANGTPAPRDESLPKMSRCPADSLWLQPAGALRSDINLRKFSAGKFSASTALRLTMCRAARPRVALSESNVVSEDNRDTKEGYLRGEHPLGTSLPPFFVKRKEGPVAA